MDKIKSFIHNLSFRASFIFYVVIFAFISLFLILITTYACQKASYKIHAAYSADDGSFYVKIPDGEKGEKVELSAEAVNKLLENMTFTDSDLAKISFHNLIKYLCIPVYSLLCLIVATMLFYRNKMKRPLDILRTAHQRVSDNDLDFTVHYDSKDEMGELVQSFEKMRAALFENNRKMWRQMNSADKLTFHLHMILELP